jgi:transposase
VSEPDRGRRRWRGKHRQRDATYANRRRIRGRRGKRLMRQRAELVERGFAHCCDTGGMRRLHLRGRDNVAKRVLLQVGGFNLGLVMRRLVGAGRPRGRMGSARLGSRDRAGAASRGAHDSHRSCFDAVFSRHSSPHRADALDPRVT